jgi:hypothetical protein
MWKWWTRSGSGEDGTDEETSTLDEAMEEGMEVVVIECAWCLAEQGIVPMSGSHGICAVHAQQLRESAAARRRRLAGG